MSPRKNPADSRDFVERATFVIVGAVLGIVPLLLFFFSFGNVGLLGTSLGVDHWIAFLTGPAVDLAVAGCVIASSYLSTRGWTERQLWPLHTAATVCGLVMILLNTGGAVYSTRWRLAAFDSVGPLMLVGWGLIAPWLWRNLTEARRQSGGSAAPASNRGDARQRASTGAPASASAPGTGAAPNPAANADAAPPVPPSDAAPPRQRTGSESGSGHVVVPFAAAPGRRSPADWAKLALPLWTRHVEQAHATPTATELAALLRHAHPGLAIPTSDRWERNLRSATEELANADPRQDREQEAG